MREAHAEPPPVDYSVDPRAKGCPTAAAFRAEVDRQTGQESLAVPSLGPWPRVDVHVELAEGGGLRAHIDVDEPSTTGEAPHHRRQTLNAPAYACRDLSSAAAITVSLVFRAAADARAQEAEPPPPPLVTSPPSSPPSASALPPPPPRRPAARPGAVVRHSLFAGGLMGKTVGPGVGAGVLVGYQATWRQRWGLVAEASATFPRIASGARDAGVVITTRTVSIAPCARYGIAHVCAFAMLGSTVGSGTNVRAPQTLRFLEAELGLRIGARLALAGPFFFRPEVRGGIPLVRSHFLIEGDTVWETPPATVTGSVSLETIF